MKKLFIILVLILFPVLVFARTTHYVSNGGANSKTGADWDNSWDYMDVFQSSTSKWCTNSNYPKDSPSCDNLIGAGDTVYIDGGTDPGVTYTHSFAVNKISGAAGHPIIIKLDAANSLHNFKVTIDPNYATDDVYHKMGFYITKNYITIDGEVSGEGKLLIQRAYSNGVEMSGIGIKLTYLEIALCGNVIVDPSGNVLWSGGVDDVRPTPTSPVEISYCYIHNSSATNKQKNIKLSPGSSGEAIQYGEFNIHHNIFKDAATDHIEMATGGVDVYNNIFFNETTETYDYLHVFCNYNRIYNNEFYGNTGGVVVYWEGHEECMASGIPSDFIFMNNVSHPPTTAGDGYARGIVVAVDGTVPNALLGPKRVYIVNNTLYDLRFNALYFAMSTQATSVNTSDVIIVNNLIKDGYCTGATEDPDYCGTSLVTLGLGDGTVTYGGWGSGANIIFDYNSIFATTGYGTNMNFNNVQKTYPDAFKAVCTYGGIPCQNHHVVTDPLLTATYSLGVGSPAINAGVDLSVIADLPLTTDYLGNARTGLWDIGAYEYTGIVPNVGPFTTGSGSTISIGSGTGVSGIQ